MKTKILADFQICISVPLRGDRSSLISLNLLGANFVDDHLKGWKANTVVHLKVFLANIKHW